MMDPSANPCLTSARHGTGPPLLSPETQSWSRNAVLFHKRSLLRTLTPTRKKKNNERALPRVLGPAVSASCPRGPTQGQSKQVRQRNKYDNIAIH